MGVGRSPADRWRPRAYRTTYRRDTIVFGANLLAGQRRRWRAGPGVLKGPPPRVGWPRCSRYPRPAARACRRSAGQRCRLRVAALIDPAPPPKRDLVMRCWCGRAGGRDRDGHRQRDRFASPVNRVLQARYRSGMQPAPYSCRQGFCGTCHTRVFGGTVDHRDTLVTLAERRGEMMLVCVWRARQGEHVRGISNSRAAPLPPRSLRPGDRPRRLRRAGGSRAGRSPGRRA